MNSLFLEKTLLGRWSRCRTAVHSPRHPVQEGPRARGEPVSGAAGMGQQGAAVPASSLAAPPSLQEFVKDAGSYSKKMVDDLLDQITGGDHSRMLFQLRQVGCSGAPPGQGAHPAGAARWGQLFLPCWSLLTVCLFF